MKCYNCGFENKPGVSFCHQCGVNLKNYDADVLNKEFKINKKRKAYPAPPENSIKAKLMYKRDNRTGKLRIAKTKCATLIVFTIVNILLSIILNLIFFIKLIL